MKTVHRLVFAIFALASATTANAAEITVICSNGIRAVVDELVPKDAPLLPPSPTAPDQVENPPSGSLPFELHVPRVAMKR